MQGRYNTRSPAVKRLMREAQELCEPTDQYFAQPLEDNLFEWHFTVRGPVDSDFENGIYHGRIVLPVDYPMKPPSIIWLTPNGRFETNKKICLSISGHHPESWQPSWSIRTALLAIIGFMPTHSGGAIGSLEYTSDERKVLAKKSRDWKCLSCGNIQNVLLEPSAQSGGPSDEAKKLAAQINFQGEKPKQVDAEKPSGPSGSSPPVSSKEESAKTSPSQTSVQGATKTTSPSVATTETITPSPSLGVPQAPPSQLPNTIFWPPPSNALSWNSPVVHPVTSMMPRFPYPPSQIQNGFSPYFNPSFVNMLPYPFPFNSGQPKPFIVSSQNLGTAVQPVSSNDAPAVPTSSSSDSLPRQSSPSKALESTPVSVSKSPGLSVGSGTQQDRSSPSSPSQETAPQDKVLAELLNKVKRVGSEDAVSASQATAVNLKEETTDTKTLEADNNVGDSSITNDVVRKSVSHGHTDSEVSCVLSDGHTDSEVSLCHKKKETEGGATNSDISHQDLPVDGEDNSDFSDLSIDIGEQRSGPDFSASSPIAGAENRKNRAGKTVRQRQSATVSLPSDVTENNPTPANAATEGQRIEAAVGDMPAHLRPGHRVLFNQAANNMRVRNYRIDQLANRQQSFFNSENITNIILVCLSIITIFILLNRILQTVGVF